jgi:hypothetical protein
MKKKMSAERIAALNALMQRIEAIPLGENRLEWVKAMVAETLRWPGTSEEMKAAVLIEMENGGYEALLQHLLNVKIPADFDPKDRPWNRKQND